jgi:CheY-like chemotaxis protein
MSKDKSVTEKKNKEKLLAISDLSSEKIDQMKENQLQDYIRTLSVCVNVFPAQKEKLESAFLTMDYASVLQWLKIIRNSLFRIHADNLAKECEKQINLNHDLENIRHEKFRVFIDYFISSLTMFFADITRSLSELESEQKHESKADIIRDKLLTVSELNSEKIEKMTEAQLADYTEQLISFHEDFGAQENGLKNSVKIKHYAFVMQWLTGIEDSLSKIHADELLEECRSQISLNKDYNNIRHERLEVFVNYFLSSLSMLASDIKTLDLPKQEQKKENHGAAVEVELVSSGAKSSSSRSILIINKSKSFFNSIRLALRDTGHELLGATSSDNAFAYLKRAKPDLFILDDDMPGIAGYELTKKIREAGQMAPIIFTARNITKADMVKVIEAGVADIIIKPIAAGELQKKVALHLSK